MVKVQTGGDRAVTAFVINTMRAVTLAVVKQTPVTIFIESELPYPAGSIVTTVFLNVFNRRTAPKVALNISFGLAFYSASVVPSFLIKTDVAATTAPAITSGNR